MCFMLPCTLWQHYNAWMISMLWLDNIMFYNQNEFSETLKYRYTIICFYFQRDRYFWPSSKCRTCYWNWHCVITLSDTISIFKTKTWSTSFQFSDKDRFVFINIYLVFKIIHSDSWFRIRWKSSVLSPAGCLCRMDMCSIYPMFLAVFTRQLPK